MNEITTAKYATEDLQVVVVNGSVFVPVEADGKWQRAIDAWLEEGNEIGTYEAPAPSTIVSPVDFMDMLGFESLTSIEIAAESDPQVRVISKYLSLVQSIDLTSHRLTSMLGLLWQKGLLTDEQITNITGSGE